MGASTDDGVTVLLAQLEAEEGQEPRLIEMRLMDGSANLPTPAIDLQYVPCGMGRKASDFPKSVKNRIALVERGELTFLEKAQNAQKAGALACVIYNNGPGSFFGTLGDGEIPAMPVVSISQEDGQYMLEFVGDRKISKAKLKLNPEGVPQSDRLAEFSSRGPNNDGWIKPELTAPGVNINSATIVEAPSPGGGMPDSSGYTSASGTSMATPHVAGAVALIRQAHPDWTPMQIKAALVNTAQFMAGQGGVMDQGAGVMGLRRAIDCKAILVTVATPFAPTHSFGQVVNDGVAKTVSQALTIQPLSPEINPGPFALSVEVVPPTEGLRAELSVGSIHCEQSCVATFDLILTADGNLLPDGVYYGWVIAKAEWGALRLPFYYEAARTPGINPVDPKGDPLPEQPPVWRRVGVMCCE